jgi:hypothetical protein
MAASPWQHPVSHFRPHPPVSRENTKWMSSPTHRNPLIWHPVNSSYFQKLNWSWKAAGLIPFRRSRPNRKECLTLWQKRTSRNHSKIGGDGRTGAYMREELLRGWWRPIGLMVSFIIFTASVRNILDISSYIATWKSREFLLLTTGGSRIPKIAQFLENYIGTERKIGNLYN